MSMKNAETSQKKNEESKDDAPKKRSGLTTNQKIMIGGFTVLIIAIVAAAAIIVSIMNKPGPPQPEGGNLIINEDNLAQIEKEISAKVEDGMFMTDMTIDWSFPNGKSTSTNAYVGNMVNNRHPISFELVNNGEVIYTSDVIPSGYSLKEITLDTDLPAGTYSMVCNYHILNEETGETINNLGINITVRILN